MGVLSVEHTKEYLRKQVDTLTEMSREEFFNLTHKASDTDIASWIDMLEPVYNFKLKSLLLGQSITFEISCQHYKFLRIMLVNTDTSIKFNSSLKDVRVSSKLYRNILKAKIVSPLIIDMREYGIWKETTGKSCKDAITSKGIRFLLKEEIYITIEKETSEDIKGLIDTLKKSISDINYFINKLYTSPDEFQREKCVEIINGFIDEANSDYDLISMELYRLMDVGKSHSEIYNKDVKRINDIHDNYKLSAYNFHLHLNTIRNRITRWQNNISKQNVLFIETELVSVDNLIKETVSTLNSLNELLGISGLEDTE